MSSERRGAELLLLDSIRAFQSMLLKVMVAVRRRWLQRMTSRELQARAGKCIGSADVSTESGSESEDLRLRTLDRPVRPRRTI